MGTCFIGCGEMVSTMGKKCVDVEANDSEQSEKLASLLGSDSEMKVSPDETQKSNSNNIECCKRSNISFLKFLFCLTFCLHKLYSSAFGQLVMSKHYVCSLLQYSIPLFFLL